MLDLDPERVLGRPASMFMGDPRGALVPRIRLVGSSREDERADRHVA